MLVRCRGKTVLEINLYRAKSCFCHIKDIEGKLLLCFFATKFIKGTPVTMIGIFC